MSRASPCASLPSEQDFRIPIEAMQRVVDAPDMRMNQVATMVMESLESKLQETQVRSCVAFNSGTSRRDET